eukprot:1186659-Prorocentrum_minimum.AAC.2
MHMCTCSLARKTKRRKSGRRTPVPEEVLHPPVPPAAPNVARRAERTLLPSDTTRDVLAQARVLSVEGEVVLLILLAAPRQQARVRHAPPANAHAPASS